MSDGLFSPSTLAKQVAGYFGVEMSIERIIANTISVSRTAKATVYQCAQRIIRVYRWSNAPNLCRYAQDGAAYEFGAG